MATGSDQAVGWGLVCLATFLISYYTVWVIVLPFVESDQAIHQFFPHRIYALAFPLLLGIVGLFVIGLFVAVTMMKANRKEKKN